MSDPFKEYKEFVNTQHAPDHLITQAKQQMQNKADSFSGKKINGKALRYVVWAAGVLLLLSAGLFSYRFLGGEKIVFLSYTELLQENKGDIYLANEAVLFGDKVKTGNYTIQDELLIISSGETPLLPEALQGERFSVIAGVNVYFLQNEKTGQYIAYFTWDQTDYKVMYDTGDVDFDDDKEGKEEFFRAVKQLIEQITSERL